MTILCPITGVSETTAQVIIAKLEAESTAYVIRRALSLDTSDYSFGYVASWAGGGEQAIAGIKGSCELN